MTVARIVQRRAPDAPARRAAGRRPFALRMLAALVCVLLAAMLAAHAAPAAAAPLPAQGSEAAKTVTPWTPAAMPASPCRRGDTAQTPALQLASGARCTVKCRNRRDNCLASCSKRDCRSRCQSRFRSCLLGCN